MTTPIRTQQKIFELAESGMSKSEILRMMSSPEMQELYGPPPHQTTIGRLIASRRRDDTSGPWSLMAATDEEIERIVPALADILLFIVPRQLPMTRDHAAMLTKVLKAQPETPGRIAFRFAHRYMLYLDRGISTDVLDAALAFKPWADGESALNYMRWWYSQSRKREQLADHFLVWDQGIALEGTDSETPAERWERLTRHAMPTIDEDVRAPADRQREADSVMESLTIDDVTVPGFMDMHIQRWRAAVFALRIADDKDEEGADDE